MNLEEEYKNRNRTFSEKAEVLGSKYNRISIIRLIYFLIGIGLIIFLFQFSILGACLYGFIFLVASVYFIKWHNQFKHQQSHFTALSDINLNELKGINNDHSNFDQGSEFIDVNHPYSYDLDIFGPHSFFQSCNRTVTSLGKSCLAQMFIKASDTAIIELRQEAIQELSKKLDWRQDFQAIGNQLKDHPAHLNILKSWLGDPPFVINNKTLNILRFVVPVISIIGLILAFYIPLVLALLFFIPALLVLKRKVEEVNDTHLRTTHTEKILAKYAALIEHIERESFNSKLLQDLKSNFGGNRGSTVKIIKRLSYLISQLNVRHNAFAIILNLIGLWDIQWVAKLEKWKEENGDQLPKWFSALKEFDALISLGNLDYNHPSWTYPKIQEHGKLTGIGMGHPLIARDEMIANDFIMPTSEHIKLVTGSNMAGKSTFLRTVALNIVLALSGSKVCAKEFTLPQLAVYTSMRTTDALHESTSSFYAELKRLKIILDAVDRKEQVYFLLDEILKGTNSKDRHTGSKALIEQLIKSGGAGIIATHDLELSSLENKYDGNLENLCMEVEVKEDQLFFDYKLKKGVSKSFNATTLMRNMGIKINKDL